MLRRPLTAIANPLLPLSHAARVVVPAAVTPRRNVGTAVATHVRQPIIGKPPTMSSAAVTSPRFASLTQRSRWHATSVTSCPKPAWPLATVCVMNLTRDLRSPHPSHIGRFRHARRCATARRNGGRDALTDAVAPSPRRPSGPVRDDHPNPPHAAAGARTRSPRRTISGTMAAQIAAPIASCHQTSPSVAPRCPISTIGSISQ